MTSVQAMWRTVALLLLELVATCVQKDVSGIDPKFSAPISNVTVPVGREGVMTCTVHDLYKYKVAWLRVDTQTILTIETLVITKSERITITHTEQRIWQLRIKDIKESDKGWYMCQINTDPMKSQMGYLNVVVPPDILDHQTSQDMTVSEGSNVSLTCVATGVPEPAIVWKRAGEKALAMMENSGITTHDGSVLNIFNVQRHNAGAYHCIASNGVSPTVSKRIMVTVDFAPIVRVPIRQYTAEIGQRVSLECFTESHPDPITYWQRGKGEIILPGVSEVKQFSENVYRVAMQIVVHLQRNSDFGIYKCVAKNELGVSEEAVKIQKRMSKITILDEPPTIILEETNPNTKDSTISQQNKFRDLILRTKNSTASRTTLSRRMVSALVLLIVLICTSQS
ncbi:neurotrimin-like isoform X1 [Wyeomyia smithii]|uniref:neurotrimin-like isoform X1 n=2 Tax=Wyeomyia smithii TaxID=174621 RepID=UPI00246816C7|nr:neurotrimin-like isoform X1 [Wyeomyia smithii]XP_055547421.1 neurotrimin-like isoform X1 [Wyeomyia smithii]XP_055547422.1 neurotrimin-like isoform X1 [Wyeomyia smithii]